LPDRDLPVAAWMPERDEWNPINDKDYNSLEEGMIPVSK
jgi:hypothetical protein